MIPERKTDVVIFLHSIVKDFLKTIPHGAAKPTLNDLMSYFRARHKAKTISHQELKKIDYLNGAEGGAIVVTKKDDSLIVIKNDKPDYTAIFTQAFDEVCGLKSSPIAIDKTFVITTSPSPDLMHQTNKDTFSKKVDTGELSSPTTAKLQSNDFNMDDMAATVIKCTAFDDARYANLQAIKDKQGNVLSIHSFDQMDLSLNFSKDRYRTFMDALFTKQAELIQSVIKEPNQNIAKLEEKFLDILTISSFMNMFNGCADEYDLEAKKKRLLAGQLLLSTVEKYTDPKMDILDFIKSNLKNSFLDIFQSPRPTTIKQIQDFDFSTKVSVEQFDVLKRNPLMATLIKHVITTKDTEGKRKEKILKFFNAMNKKYCHLSQSAASLQQKVTNRISQYTQKEREAIKDYIPRAEQTVFLIDLYSRTANNVAAFNEKIIQQQKALESHKAAKLRRQEEDAEYIALIRATINATNDSIKSEETKLLEHQQRITKLLEHQQQTANRQNGPLQEALKSSLELPKTYVTHLKSSRKMLEEHLLYLQNDLTTSNDKNFKKEEQEIDYNKNQRNNNKNSYLDESEQVASKFPASSKEKANLSNIKHSNHLVDKKPNLSLIQQELKSSVLADNSSEERKAPPKQNLKSSKGENFNKWR